MIIVLANEKDIVLARVLQDTKITPHFVFTKGLYFRNSAGNWYALSPSWAHLHKVSSRVKRYLEENYKNAL